MLEDGPSSGGSAGGGGRPPWRRPPPGGRFRSRMPAGPAAPAIGAVVEVAGGRSRYIGRTWAGGAVFAAIHTAQGSRAPVLVVPPAPTADDEEDEPT